MGGTSWWSGDVLIVDRDAAASSTTEDEILKMDALQILQQPLKKRSCWLTRFVSITFFLSSVSPDLHTFLLTACPPVTRPSSASLQADLATQHLSLFLMCIQKKVGSVCAESNLMKPCLHVALITFKYLMCQSQLLTSISFAICWILHCVVIWGMEACMSNFTTC